MSVNTPRLPVHELPPLLQEAWHPGERPHLLKHIAFTTKEHLEVYNSFGSEKDRGLEQHRAALGFGPEHLPANGALLVIGSGIGQRFERELHDVRPDIKVFSVDSLLRHGVKERIREGIRMASSSTPPEPDRMGYGVSFPDEVLGEHPYFRPGAIAGAVAVKGFIKQVLPIQGKIFDEVVGLHSLPQYARPEEVPFMLDEVVRVMKPGARARFYPFYPEDLGALEEPEFRNEVTGLHIGELEPSYQYTYDDWAPDHRRVTFQRA